MNELFPITKFKADSRSDDHILCYDDVWSKKNYKTWKDFLIDTAKLRIILQGQKSKSYILHSEDNWLFLCTFVALLQCKKTIYITQTISESFMEEVKKSDVCFLTDQTLEDKEIFKKNTYFIPELIKNAAEPSEEEIRTTPEIDQEKAEFYLYTSGSTGKPKAVYHTMKDMEVDNGVVISLWGEEYAKRKLITTVSQHHVYGLYWTIALPFTMGLPFRRQRIEFPSEFEKLNDTSYVLVSTPAFLKRTVEVIDKLNMRDIFISVSGGALSEELAIRSQMLFGFCPMEGYGSTETSGIAYRQQSRDGLKWTPYDCVKLWVGEDGCLNVISPFIKDPAGVATADLVEIFDDGRFLLKGRSDSIVKIEEKRISMTEVENRLLESGLVSEVKVVALSNDVRQYLAAALVLNAKGREQFKDSKKNEINRYFHDFLMKFFENVVIPKKWRFVEKLPSDVQGKIHKMDVIALFN